MHAKNRGFTLVEVLGALAIGSALAAGVAAMIDNSLAESKGEQAALYQARVVEAATKYINVEANYTRLLADTVASQPSVVTAAMLQTAGYLSQNFMPTNAYGQAPCVLVLQGAAGRLDALVVTEGGAEIPGRDVASVAANAGQGGGYIPSATPAIAQGAFKSWSLPLAGFGNASCSGTAAAANHLASAVFFDGPGQLATDFLYREAKPGRPELNQMFTPLNMRAQALEGSSDALCIVGDTGSYGRIAVDASGALLNCQLGVWKRAGGHWKDPAASFSALPATGNDRGDVRLALDIGRAFSWNGAAWVALAVDQLGNLAVPGRLTANEILVEQIVTHRAACEPDGLLGRDANGMLMSCQLGIWRKFVESEITATVFSQYFWSTPVSGDVDTIIDLLALPGTRPLFITGDACCVSYDDQQAVIRVELYDASGLFLGYAGGCASQSALNEGRVASATPIALQKIPENAAYVRLTMRTSGDIRSRNEATVTILNSR